MKSTTLTRMLLAACLALPLGAMAQDQQPPMREHRAHRPHGMPFLHGLDLSDAQDDKLFQLMHGQEPYLREQQRTHERAMRTLHEMRHGDKYDDAAAAKAAQAAAQAQANISLLHVRTHQKVLALLTPEQRQQLAERKERPRHER